MGSLFDPSGSLVLDTFGSKVYFFNEHKHECSSSSNNNNEMNHTQQEGQDINQDIHVQVQQDINENSVVMSEAARKEKENSRLPVHHDHRFESTEILTHHTTTKDISTKFTPKSVPRDLDWRGSGDDSGTYSEVVDTSNATTPSPIKATNGSGEFDDPEKLIHCFLRASASCPQVPTLIVANANANAKSNERCEPAEVKSYDCDAEQSDNYICDPDHNSQESSCIGSSCSESKSNVTSDSYLNTLVMNFNQMYEGKLGELNKSTNDESGMELIRRKNALCQEWIKDLNDQNALLIQTVEEMEKETEVKIESLQRKMQKSTKLTESHMLMITEYEKQVQEFLSQRIKDERNAEESRLQVDKIEVSNRKLREKLHTTETQVESLVALITRVRDMGVWDIIGLNFEPRTYSRLFGLYPNLPGTEVQTVFTKEKAKKARDAQKQLEHLSNKLEELTNYKSQFEEILVEKESTIKALEDENSQLKDRTCELENLHSESKTILDETKSKLMEANMRLDINLERTNAQEKELNELRVHLSTVCHERENTKHEADLLKNEMNHKMEEIRRMKNLLRSIQAETESTKAQVRDVQSKQISPLREEIQLYQSKYEEAKKSLRAKTEMIENLQTQMEQLQQKENSSSGAGDKNGDLISTQSYHELQNQVSSLTSQLLSKDTLISSLHCEVQVEKLAKAGLLSSMESKDVEITMQKVTIKHLQDALVNLKKSTGISQPPPIQGPSVPSNKVFDI